MLSVASLLLALVLTVDAVTFKSTDVPDVSCSISCRRRRDGGNINHASGCSSEKSIFEWNSVASDKAPMVTYANNGLIGHGHLFRSISLLGACLSLDRNEALTPA